MKNLVKDRTNTLKEELSDLEFKIKLLQEKIILEEKYIKDLKYNSEKKRKSDLEKIKETEKLIIKLNEEIEDHKDMVLSLINSIIDKSSMLKKNKELDSYKLQINKNLKKLNK